MTAIDGAAKKRPAREKAVARALESAAPHGVVIARGAPGVHAPPVETRICRSAISLGEHGTALATDARSAAVASGADGTALATGAYGAAMADNVYGTAHASGLYGSASADHESSIAIATGEHGRVLGVAGSALFLIERDEYGTIIAAWAGVVGRDGIKPDVWYRLRDGKPVEVLG